jgi:hypothetical protein
VGYHEWKKMRGERWWEKGSQMDQDAQMIQSLYWRPFVYENRRLEVDAGGRVSRDAWNAVHGVQEERDRIPNGPEGSISVDTAPTMEG